MGKANYEKRNEQMIKMRNGKNPKSLEEIAEKFHISRQRVHQIIGGDGFKVSEIQTVRLKKDKEKIEEIIYPFVTRKDRSETVKRLAGEYGVTLATFRNHVKVPRIILPKNGLKYCSAGRHILPTSEFGRCSSTRDGLNAMCKACNAKNTMRHYRKTHKVVRRHKNKYGIVLNA